MVTKPQLFPSSLSLQEILFWKTRSVRREKLLFGVFVAMSRGQRDLTLDESAELLSTYSAGGHLHLEGHENGEEELVLLIQAPATPALSNPCSKHFNVTKSMFTKHNITVSILFVNNMKCLLSLQGFSKCSVQTLSWVWSSIAT
jgi:hypothetical protein